MIFFPVVNLSTDHQNEAENSCPQEDNEDSGSRGWRSLSLPTSQDVARALEAAAVGSTRPSVAFSSQDGDCSSPSRRLQNQVSRALKGFSCDRKSLTYNPEFLQTQKQQWASFRLRSFDHCSLEMPSKLFENIVVVGLHPSFDVQMLRKCLQAKKCEVSGRLRFALSRRSHSHVETNFEPQVLFAFPPEKQLPVKCRDLLSFCFPGGVEVHAIERNSSMSELNEILLGQEHLKRSDLSFVFRLQVPNSSPLYGCCVLMEELLDKPSPLISMISNSQAGNSHLERHIFTTGRCYCILSHLPFFELHFGVLNRMFMEERLERLTRSMSILDQVVPDNVCKVEGLEENEPCLLPKHLLEDEMHVNNGTSQSSFSDASVSVEVSTIGSHVILSDLKSNSCSSGKDTDSISSTSYERNALIPDKGPNVAQENSEASNFDMDSSAVSKPTMDYSPGCVRPLLQNQQLKSFEPSSSFQGSPCEGRHFRGDNDEADTEETSTSGQQDYICHNDILEWAKANNHGSLQIICEYYKLDCPPRGSTITFHPLKHLYPLEFHRPDDERLLHISGSPLDLRSCKTMLERAEVLNALIAEEEATTLSAWAISRICVSLGLEHVLTVFAGALLEKQIVFVCSNLGILSASVLSLIPLIRPYQWQSLLMPVLPNDMLDFLEAPVPYIVGVQNKTSEVQSKLTNAILVDVTNNQVRSPSLPQLPKQDELLSSLVPYHSKLVGEGHSASQRPISECTDEQVEAAKGFMEVLRNYLDSLCSNLHSHIMINVQSNDDEVSQLSKESFIDSFPSCDRPFMKFFVDTQMFSVHTDLVLFVNQKD